MWEQYLKIKHLQIIVCWTYISKIIHLSNRPCKESVFISMCREKIIHIKAIYIILINLYEKSIYIICINPTSHIILFPDETKTIISPKHIMTPKSWKYHHHINPTSHIILFPAETKIIISPKHMMNPKS